MLVIQRQKFASPEMIIIAMVVSLGAATAFVAVQLSETKYSIWQRDLCADISVTEYKQNAAPSKCQALWNMGGLR